MPINIPTIQQLSQKTRQLFNANLTGADAFLSPNVLYVISKVFALSLWPVYQSLGYVQRQIFASTADKENLERHANEIGLTRNPATYAKGYVVITATSGAELNQGDMITRSDGIQYVVDEDIILTGNDEITVTALVAGSNANTVSGTTLQMVIANPDITAILIASNGLSGGADTENDESLRKRVLYRKRNLNLSGTESYYTNILQDNIAGITRIFFQNLHQGVGTFAVYFMMDDTYADGIPLTGDIALAQSLIESSSIQGVIGTVFSPALHVIDISVQIKGTFTPTQETQIKLELEDIIHEEGIFSTVTNPQTFLRENLDQAISRGLGSNAFVMTSPITDIIIPAGKLPALGTVTLVAV